MTRDIGLRFPNLPSFAHSNKRDSNSGGNSLFNLPTFGSSGNFLLSNNQQSITEISSSQPNSIITEEKNGNSVRWNISNIKSAQNFLNIKSVSRSPPLLSPKDDNSKYESEITYSTLPVFMASSPTVITGLQSQTINLNEKPNKTICSSTRSSSTKSKYLISKSSNEQAERSLSTTSENY